MANATLSQRETVIRRWAYWISLVALAVLGVYHAWRITHLQRLHSQAVQERIAQAARSEYIVNTANVAMIMCDARGTITAFNPAAERIFVSTKEEMLGQSIHDLVGEADRKKHVAAFEKAVVQLQAMPGDWQTSCSIRGMASRKDGLEFGVITSVSGIKYGDRIEFLSVIQPSQSGVVEVAPYEQAMKPFDGK